MEPHIIEQALHFTKYNGGYAARTYANAKAPGVDATMAFAVDFNTAGERCTAKAAGDSLIRAQLPLKSEGGLDLSDNAIANTAQIVEAGLSRHRLTSSFNINFAGNGIYTLTKYGVNQYECDLFLAKLLTKLISDGYNIRQARSGAQTGIDEAAATACLALAIPFSGYIPEDFKFRGTNGVDVAGNRDSFYGRFYNKDYDAIRQCLNLPAITEFQKEYRFLSNFWLSDVYYDGALYPSAENAFQAAKSADIEVRKQFEATTPQEARNLGRSVALRPDWENVKLDVMKSIVSSKFSLNPELQQKLLETGIRPLQEGNYWHDTFWGIDLSTGKGENHLGKILMEVRASYQHFDIPVALTSQIFVSYYASKNIPENAFRVQISNTRPGQKTGNPVEVDTSIKALFPDWNTVLGPHKDGKIDNKEYTARYRAQLQANKDAVLSEINAVREAASRGGRPIVLLCYERPGEFCHRYIVHNWLIENGIKCQELPGDRQMYSKGKVRLLNDIPTVEQNTGDLFNTQTPDLDYRDGWALVRTKDGKFNYLNEDDGTLMSAKGFTKATQFKDGKATVETSTQVAQIDTKGIVLSVRPKGNTPPPPSPSLH